MKGNGLDIAGWGHSMGLVLWSVARFPVFVSIDAGNSCDLSQVPVLRQRTGLGSVDRQDMGLDRG